jgi:hypothetical protein
MEEQDFIKMMQQSKLEIPVSGFDEMVMDKIHAKEASRRSVWKNLKISWFFFFIGTCFGLCLTHFLADIQVPFLGESSKLVLLFGEIVIVLVVASQFDSLFRFTFKKRE